MTLPDCKTLNEAIAYIQEQRKWRPFMWAGRFFIGQFSDGWRAYRSKAALVNAASKDTSPPKEMSILQ